MQLTVREAKFLKEGTNKKGAWKLYKVVAEDGTEYTTFDTKVADLPPGTVIELGDITIKDGNERSFKDFAIVSQPDGAAARSSGGNGYKPYGENPEVRASIESQAAIRAVTDLLCADKDVPVKVKAAYDDWLLTKLGGQLAPEAPRSKSSEKAPEPREDEEPFPNVGALMKWCTDNGVDRPTFKNLIGVDEEGIARVDIAEAHKVIKDFIAIRDTGPAGVG